MNSSIEPVVNALRIIGGKWKIAILYQLNESPCRFGELKKTLNPITQQMLTKQLRELEKDGLISEDERHQQEAEVQKVTDIYVKKVDDAQANKEKEITQV